MQSYIYFFIPPNKSIKKAKTDSLPITVYNLPPKGQDGSLPLLLCIQIFLFCFVINIWYSLGGLGNFFCGSMISVFRCSQKLIQIGFQFLYYGLFLLSAFSLAIIQHFSDSTKYFTWFFWNYLITIFHFDWNKCNISLKFQFIEC